jgi:hypothetical protein
MTPEERAKTEFNNSSDKGLRGELALWGYNPSPVIKKEIMVNMLIHVYFGGENIEV